MNARHIHRRYAPLFMMKIKHKVNLDKSLVKESLLEQVLIDIEKYYCWTGEIRRGRINFINKEKLNIIRRPTYNIKSGVIQLNHNSSPPNLYCETDFPNHILWISIGLFITGIMLNFVTQVFPLTPMIIFSVSFLIMNYLAFRLIFKFSINRTLKRIKTVHNNGEHP